MSWRYDQRHGDLFHNELYIATGYSGFPPHTNRPDDEAVKGLGPIPKGKYFIGRPYDSPNVGPFALPLEAMPETVTFGRGDLRIHGDSRIHPGAASHGCIILSPGIRHQIADSGDEILEVFCSEFVPIDPELAN